MHNDSFSKRLGLSPPAAKVAIVNDAPQHVREAILMIAEGDLDISPGTIRSILCTLLRKLPNRDNWSVYPNVWDECQQLMTNEAPWYTVYDFVEAVHSELIKNHDVARANQWSEAINSHFEQAGVAWRLVGGVLERRTAGGAEFAVDSARVALTSPGHATARCELEEAVHDLSRRPAPDLTGAVQHAMAALECTAREVTGDHNATLGSIIKRYPTLFPSPIDEALTKLWGFASETARHLREGRAVQSAEAELVVAVSAAAAAYLPAAQQRAST